MTSELSKSAQAYYDELLEGTAGKDGGVIALHTGLSAALSNMQRDADNQPTSESNLVSAPTSAPHSIDTRRKLASLKRTVGYLDGVIQRIGLFKTRDEMNDLYYLLHTELAEEEQWRAFLSSALRATVDTDVYLKMAGQSKSLAHEIANTAGKLAEQINQMQKLELDNMPEELFSLWQLLQKTNENGWSETSLSKWREAKEAILGEAQLWPDPSMALKPMDHPSPAYDLIKDDLSECLARIQNTGQAPEDPQSTLHPAWIAAPPVQTVLRTLESSASGFSRSIKAAAGDAIHSSKPDRIQDYIRTLVYLLTQEHQILISTNIKNAIAIAATVSFCDLGFTISHDDVNAALV